MFVRVVELTHTLSVVFFLSRPVSSLLINLCWQTNSYANKPSRQSILSSSLKHLPKSPLFFSLKQIAQSLKIIGVIKTDPLAVSLA